MTLWPNGRWSYAWQQLSAGYLMVYFPLLGLLIWPWLMGQTNSIQPTNLLLLTSSVALGLIMLHSWIGLRDILIDYCPARYLRPAWYAFRLVMLLISFNLLVLMVMFRLGGQL